MSDVAVRVALLGRAGKARDQLHRALTESGAAIVAEGDPSELDPATVAGLSPTCYLVSLEPAIERSLERFDDLLAAPGVEVMFDDAETSARLDGWDLNRWARHIANKLLGHDGLPPAPEGSLYGYDDAPPPPSAPGAALLETSFADNVAAAESDDDDLSDSIGVDDASGSGGGLDFDGGFGLELPGSLSPSGSESGRRGDSGGLDFPTGTDDDLSDSIDYSAESQDGVFDLDVDALSAQLEALGARDVGISSADPAHAFDPAQFDAEEIRSVPVPDVLPESAPLRRAAGSIDFSNLSLAPQGEALQLAQPAPTRAVEYDDSLRLAPVSGHEGLGAVVILAGLGGPDAVRQLLASLPDTLPAPVLLYQHLEVGKHERLVDQLAKISKLPVQLAKLGERPGAGRVSLLSAGMTAMAQDDSLVFVQGDLVTLLNAISARESMVVVLSGADPQLVPTILQVRDAGGSVLVQDPHVCFDAAAAEVLQAEGAAALPALGLARQIADRWSH